MVKRITISLHRTISALDAFRLIFTEKLQALALSEDEVSQFELCVYEVLINVIEHEKLPENESEPIKVVFTLDETKATVSLMYKGSDFDLTQSPLPNLESHFADGKKRGLGIYIIHTLMDSLDYSHEGKTSTLTMSKVLADTK